MIGAHSVPGKADGAAAGGIYRWLGSSLAFLNKMLKEMPHLNTDLDETISEIDEFLNV